MGPSRSQKTLTRFLAPGAREGQTYLLDPLESHHLQNVRRLKVGEEVLLLDLAGRELRAQIKKTGRRVLVEVKKTVREEKPPHPQVILLLPLLKKDLLSFLVEKAVELGLSRVIPYFSAYSVVKPKENLAEKLKARALQSLKQCGRLWPLEIEDPLPLASAVKTKASLKIAAYEKEKNKSLKEVLLSSPPPGSILLASGPEGGFAPDEKRLLEEASFVLVHLGEHILRAETAAFYLMSTAHFWLFL